MAEAAVADLLQGGGELDGGQSLAAPERVVAQLLHALLDGEGGQLLADVESAAAELLKDAGQGHAGQAALAEGQRLDLLQGAGERNGLQRAVAGVGLHERLAGDDLHTLGNVKVGVGTGVGIADQLLAVLAVQDAVNILEVGVSRINDDLLQCVAAGKDVVGIGLGIVLYVDLHVAGITNGIALAGDGGDLLFAAGHGAAHAFQCGGQLDDLSLLAAVERHAADTLDLGVGQVDLRHLIQTPAAALGDVFQRGGEVDGGEPVVAGSAGHLVGEQGVLADAHHGKGPFLVQHLGGNGLGNGQRAAILVVAHVLQLNSTRLGLVVEADHMVLQILVGILSLVILQIDLEIGDGGHNRLIIRLALAGNRNVARLGNTGLEHVGPRGVIIVHIVHGNVQRNRLGKTGEGIVAGGIAGGLGHGGGCHALEVYFRQRGAAAERLRVDLGNGGGDGQGGQRGVLGEHAAADLRQLGGEGDAGQAGIAAQSGDAKGDVLCLKDDLLQVPRLGHIAAHIVEASGLHGGDGGRHGDLGDLGQGLGVGIGVVAVAVAVEGVRRHGGDGIGHAILGIGAGQGDLAAQTGAVVADDGDRLGARIKNLVVEHLGLAAIGLCAADAVTLGKVMRFVGDDVSAALVRALGAVGAVTVVGVHPVVAGSGRVGRVFQTVIDILIDFEIVAVAILNIIAERPCIIRLAMQGRRIRTHIVSCVIKVIRKITKEIYILYIAIKIAAVCYCAGDINRCNRAAEFIAFDLGDRFAVNDSGDNDSGITARISGDYAIFNRKEFGVCRSWRFCYFASCRRHYYHLHQHDQTQQQRSQPL